MELRCIITRDKSYLAIVEDDIQVGEIQYKETDTVIDILHTEIYAPERGRVSEAKVAQQLKQYAREKGFLLRTQCDRL